MKKMMSLLVVAMMFLGLTFAQTGNFRGNRAKGGNYRQDRGKMMIGTNAPIRDEIIKLHEKIKTEFSDLMAKNRIAIEKLQLKIKSNNITIKEEMLKSSPSWSKVKSLMKTNEKIHAEIANIKIDEKITILKSLTPEERKLLGSRYLHHKRKGNSKRARKGGRR